jgi:urea transporter
MNKILEKWEIISASSGIVRFLDINLRSIGQVMFQDNPLTGLLFLAAIAWGSYAAGVPRVAIAGVLAVVVANLMAQWLNADSESFHSGLYG